MKPNKIYTLFNFNKRFIIVAILFLLVVLFETAQQLFYAVHFELYPEISYSLFLYKQIVSWFIWVLFSILLVSYVKKHQNREFSLSNVKQYTVLILGVVIANIIIVSCVRLLMSDFPFSFERLYNEFIPYFIFQKAPIYLICNTAVVIILNLNYRNKELQVRIEELVELKKSNLKLYNKLSKRIDDKASILNIKIGNKFKIIPVNEIKWIEADNYCVKVHSNEKMSYSMRISLKALEQKLNTNFLRVHRNAIVNMNHVKEINMSNNNLMLKDDKKVVVSKSKLKIVKDYLSQ